MIKNIIKFFLEKPKMNNMIFVIMCFMGYIALEKIPKEIFPTFDLDKIRISGGYSGTSVDILNKMAVREIEDELLDLEGINEMTSIITPGKFTITIELKEGTNKFDTLAKTKDAIDEAKQNFPSDMDEPTATTIVRSKSLLNVNVTSTQKTKDELLEYAKSLKTKIMALNDISSITIYGDSDMYYEVLVDEKKIESYGLNKVQVFDAIAGLSYIYPIGTIEGNGKHYYVSTFNGKKTAEQMEDTIININTQSIYLKDIVKINKRLEDSSTIASVGGVDSITLSISASENGDSIRAKQKIQKILKEQKKQNTDITHRIMHDNVQRITNRLNIVSSNIIMSFIIVYLLLIVLINRRIAFVVGLGIPASFIIAAVYFYAVGYSINMMSLTGVLLALGIVVDDAIVIAENIQQKLEEGMPLQEAITVGTTQMVKPVIMASLTTLFAFLPLLMLSGTLGEFVKQIPIAVSALIAASLIECFVFLPLHAKHALSSHKKEPNHMWAKANLMYKKVLIICVRNRYKFLVSFLILVPLLTIAGLKYSRFQMFPTFDSTEVSISIKTNINTKIEETYAITNELSKLMMKHKEKWEIKQILGVAGWRLDSAGTSESYPYVGWLKMELYTKKPDNFLDKYINPLISPYASDENAIRKQSSKKISKEIREFLKKSKIKEKYNLNEIFVIEKKAGPIRSDIKIGMINNNDAKIISAIETLNTKLKTIKGIRTIQSSAKVGIDEIKLKVNKYGEKLGVNERLVGQTLSNLFLSKKASTAFDEKDLLEVKLESINKDDFATIKETRIPLPNGQKVRLLDVVDYKIIKSFERVEKDMGDKMFYFYANVNPKIITASEVLDVLKPELEQIKKDGTQLVFKGEREKKGEMKRDMQQAGIIAVLLIATCMLYLFDSFRDVFITLSVIFFSFLGVLVGHFVMGFNLTMPSFMGTFGLAGVVVNDGIIMMMCLKKATTQKELFTEAAKRLRPIFSTTITTLLGLSTLIFFASGESVIFQPLSIALGFGLAWGTVLNLIYLPCMYVLAHSEKITKLSMPKDKLGLWLKNMSEKIKIPKIKKR